MLDIFSQQYPEFVFDTGKKLRDLCIIQNRTPTDYTRDGHPINRFFTRHAGLMRSRYLHIILWILLGTSARAQVVIRAIGQAAAPNDTADVRLTVSHFTDIAAIQHTLVYDPSKLAFLGATDFGLPGLNSNAFNEPQPGTIKMNWFGTPASLQDGETIYTLKFLVTGADPTRVRFDPDAEFIVADNQGMNVPHRAFYAGINGTYLEGYIYNDFNGNCLLDVGETGLNDQPVRIDGASSSHFVLSDSTGFFEMVLDTGDVSLQSLPRVTAWEACQSSQLIDIVNYSQNTVQSLLRPAYGCPYLEVDVSTAYVRPCDTLTYWVTYQNIGPAPAFGATVRIYLDSAMTYLGSSLPPTQLNGHFVEFNVGNIATNQGGRFSITVHNDCFNTVVGRTHCVRAEILPDDICDPVSPQWDGASVQVTGQCKGDSVEFKITNAGAGNMTQAKDYVIIEDMILGKEGQIQLNAGESTTLTQKTDDKTFRLIVNQSDFHPGRSYPTVALEGCDGYNANTMLGSVTEFGEDDADPFRSMDCRESVDAPIPNSITVHPKGYGAQAYITSHTDLTYLIYFKNTTTDTIHHVRIADTISPSLELYRAQPEASGHPYDFQLAGTNVLLFDFGDLQLLPGQDGFVKFRIPQKADLPFDETIQNTATILLDDQPIVTNTVTNTNGGETEKLYLIVRTEEIPRPKIRIKAFPNPFTDQVRLILEEYPKTELRLRLYDSNGSTVADQSTFTGSFRLSRSNISKGVYHFVIDDHGQIIASGTLIAQ